MKTAVRKTITKGAAHNPKSIKAQVARCIEDLKAFEKITESAESEGKARRLRELLESFELRGPICTCAPCRCHDRRKSDLDTCRAAVDFAQRNLLTGEGSHHANN